MKLNKKNFLVRRLYSESMGFLGETGSLFLKYGLEKYGLEKVPLFKSSNRSKRFFYIN